MGSSEAGQELWNGSEPLDPAAKAPLDAGEGHLPRTRVVISLPKHEEAVGRAIPAGQVIREAKAH